MTAASSNKQQLERGPGPQPGWVRKLETYLESDPSKRGRKGSILNPISEILPTSILTWRLIYTCV